MLDQDKILAFLHETGPTLPSKVAKNIQTDILFASAFLSDLASQGKVKISYLKVGGSPLYYLAGQESQLFNFARSNLNPKDYLVLEKLKAAKALREKDLDLLSKVALRSLKDFALPLHVTIDGVKELFWKWHLLSDEETNQTIRSIIDKEQIELFSKPHPEQQPELQSKSKSERQNEQNSGMQQKLNLTEPPAIEKQESILLPEAKVQQHKFFPEEKGDKSTEEQEKETEKEAGTESKTKLINEFEMPIAHKNKEKLTVKKRTASTDEFFPVLENFFTEAHIKIEQTEIVRKNTEINLLVKVPSVIGKLTYFCKAKKKAKCDEKDLSSAYMEAQIKKLPLLFIYTKEITKKAQEMLKSGVFENVILKKVG